MQLRQLRLHNFMGLAEAELQFEPGVHYIGGVNHDMGGTSGQESNGSGKSSLFDGLKWIQHETVDREEFKVDDAVNTVVGKNCLGELIYEERGKLYQIVRTRKHAEMGNTLRFWVDGEERTEHTVAETKTALQRLLPLSEKVWSFAVQVGQNMPYRFLALKESEKRDLLGEIVDLSWYDESLERAKVEEKAVGNELFSIRSLIDSKRGQIDNYSRKGGELRTALEQLLNSRGASVEAIKQELAELDAGIEQREDEIRSISEAIPELEGRIQTATEAVGTAHASVQEASNSSFSLHGQIMQGQAQQQKYGQLGTVCPTCEQEIDRERLMQKLTDMATWIDGLNRAFDEAEQTRQTAQEELRQKQTYLQDIQNSIAAANRRVQILHQEISQCRARRDFLSGQVGSFESEEAGFTAQIEQMDGLVVELQKEIAGHEEALEHREECLRHCTFWVKSIPNLKAAALEDVLEYLNLRLDEYMEILSDGIIGVRLYQATSGRGSKIKVDVRTPTGKYGVSSGGEKRRIDLALYLALSDLTRAAHGVSCNLLVADEICDGLSANGVKKFLDVLRTKAEQGMCIYVISHNPSILQSVTFDSTYLVERRGDVAVLRCA